MAHNVEGNLQEHGIGTALSMNPPSMIE